MNDYKQYRRKHNYEFRPYKSGEDLSRIYVLKKDCPPLDMGMIARNPANHKDQWYVAQKYFEDNFEEIE